MKYANQINTALVAASALFVVYILTQTYWSTDPGEEIVRPMRQEGSPVESTSPEVSTPSPERPDSGTQEASGLRIGDGPG